MATSPDRPDLVSAGNLRVAPYGEGAFLVDLGLSADPLRAARTHAAAAAIAARLPAADVVVGAGTVLVDGVSSAEALSLAEGGAIEDHGPAVAARSHRIPAVYDGPDLASAAEALGLRTEELIEIHTSAEVVVELLGFLPGFAYMGPLDPRLSLPRRSAPRPIVPAGSVGIASSFTGIYPFTSPGGWHLIGRAVGAELFDPRRDPPALFLPGDRVRFEAATAAATATATSTSTATATSTSTSTSTATATATLSSGGRGLRVIAAPVGATIQDGGRPGQLRRGLPPSGALDAAALARANAAVGNAEGAAAIEIPLGSIEVEAEGAVAISIDGAPLTRLAAGERLTIPASRRAVRYLAVQGGVDVPIVLGARATLLVARLGGLQGRALRRRDFIPVGAEEGVEAASARPMADDPGSEVLAVDPGPHLSRFPEGALDALLATEWRVSRLGDRVGVRLEGGQIPRDRPDLALPVPMRRGAVQVSTDGTPIVLGPDHPATGGYPVLAILRRSAQEALARRRPGDAARFRLA
jgi:KipI family sensor histidine kinase inhibitor